MKRFVFFMAVSLLAVSCSINDMDSKDENQGEIFHATIEQPENLGTKVYVNQDLRILWDESDHISIFNKKDSNDEYFFTGQTGDAGGSFELVKDFSEEGVAIDKVYAVYPYSRATSIDTKGNLSVEFPTEQHYRENSFGLGDNLMVSVSKDKNLQFKNAGGYLRISLYGEGASVTSITLKGNNGERLAGKASITMPLDGIPSIELADDAEDEITLTCDSPVELGSSVEESSCFWFVVPPVSFDQGFTISVNDGSGKHYEKRTTKPITIERNKLSKMSPLLFEELEPKEVKVAYNLIITGPGVVDEYLSEDGTKAILKAIPSEGAVFNGWRGSVSGNEMELVLDLNEEKDVIATFSGIVQSYPLPDLKQPWSALKCLYKGFDYRLFSNDAAGRGWIPVDYNRDGYLDVITTETFEENYFESDCDIHFYIGNPDGTFSVDLLNDNGLTGKEPRKIMYSDFNDDGLPDILMIGHGTERPGARDGAYPLILMSSPTGEYNVLRFEDLWGYYHGGTIGDIDSDGDMDIILPDATSSITYTHAIINDGTGHFDIRDDLIVKASGIYTCELYDINHDGFLDLIWGGGADGKWDGETWRAEVIWGNGHGFLSSNATSIIPNWDLITFLDFEFFDLDHDGTDEIITAITPEHYDSWELEVYKWTGSNFVSVTSEYFKPGESIGQGESWVRNIDLEEVDEKLYLVCQQFGDSRMAFEYMDGKFTRVIEDSHFVPQNGFSIYYDAKVPIDSNSGYDLHCTDNPHSGVYCIKNDPDSWGFMFKLSEAQNGADLRQLVSEGYCLEFYIKHDQPDFLVEIKFISDAINGQGANTFCYGYWGNEHVSDGKWQRIVLPLSSLESWEDETKESWGRINTLFFHAAGDYNKCPFYVDDIRIRRIIDTQ